MHCVICDDCRVVLYAGTMRPQDAMTAEAQERYETLVYDGARDLAVKYQKAGVMLKRVLLELGAPEDLADAAGRATYAPEFELAPYRGAACDEGVVEAVKDCLRVVYGFAPAEAAQ